MADRSTPRMDPWERYLHRPVSIRDAHDQNATFGAAFRSQRSAIAEIFSSLAATRVACLGSGYLSDIPVEEFAVAGADVHFVDWVPDVSLAGFQHKLFQASERPACWVCAQECPNPTDYCASYSPPPSPNPVCPAYRDAGLPFHACDSYVRGSQPSFDRADVTGGVASRFARKAGKLVRAARSPAQAFRQATRMVAELRGRPSTLTLAEDSMDLVTSSMVISQFDKEPYRYFSGLLESKFGRDRINQNEVGV